MRALRGLSLFGGLAVVLTLFFVIGCSNNTPVQPTGPSPIDLGRSLQLSGGNNYEMTGTVVYDSTYIEQSVGGTVEIKRDAYLHEFVVEPDAIEESTLITVRSVDEVILGKTMILFEFGPDGLEFIKSAILRFDTGELREEAFIAKLYYLDPEEEKWVYQYSVEVQDGIAEFEIDHFSKYAISD